MKSSRTNAVPMLGLLAFVFAGCPGSNNSPPDGGNDAGTGLDGANDAAPLDAAGDALSNNDTGNRLDAPGNNDAQPSTDAPSTADVPVVGNGTTVTMYGYEPGRTLANRNETRLTVAAVMAGGLARVSAFAPTLDDQVYNQPLYLPGVTVNGAAHDVLYVTTLNNTVYALDADAGTTLWNTHLGTPVPRTSQPCGNINTHTGILGTPVIDAAAGTLYAVAFTTNDNGATKVYTLNALDVRTGSQRAGYPVPIQPPDSNGSHFDPNTQQERGALALLNGKVYVPFGGLWGDCGTFHGWVVEIDTANPAQQRSFGTSGNESGIWAPAGPSSDGTHFFSSTGNGETDPSMGEYVIRFDTAGGLAFNDTDTSNYFTPSNRLSLDSGDVDIGSITPVVLPDHAGSSTPHLLFQSGKAGVSYVINRDNLGGQGFGDGVTGEGVYSAQLFNGGNFGASAAWTDGTGVWVFVPGHGGRATPCTGRDGVMAVQLGLSGGVNQKSNFAPAWCTASLTDATPSVSSNGNSDGILWIASGSGTTVQAYRISDGTRIWAATDAATVRKWVPPVVADGRLFVTGQNTISLYRLP